jgi:hypothetical protein
MAAVFAQGGGNADHQDMIAKPDITSTLRAGQAGRLAADGSAPQLRREQSAPRVFWNHALRLEEGDLT